MLGCSSDLTIARSYLVSCCHVYLRIPLNMQTKQIMQICVYM